MNQVQILEFTALLGIRDKYYFLILYLIFLAKIQLLSLVSEVNKISSRNNKWYWKPGTANKLFPVELELMNYGNDDI